MVDEITVNAAWESFLLKQGAVLEAGRVRHFGDAAQERRAAVQDNILADLSDQALIRARGDDALNFLNGQLSNDLRQLDAAHSQLASWCSPKGRMLVVFRLFRRGSDTLLQFPAALLESTLKRLRMFVLRAKVTLENVEAELVSIGLSGPDAKKILTEAAGFAGFFSASAVLDARLSRFIDATCSGVIVASNWMFKSWASFATPAL